jgi:FkbM family methyltransferase
MDFARLADNVAASWRRRASLPDFVRSLLFAYANKLPRLVQRQEWTIGFAYPAPIGNVRLLLRTNHGADAFIRSEVFDHQCYRLPIAQAPKTILDIGANIGLTAIYLARAFPGAALACVEPIEKNLRLLTRNLELNDVQATVFPGAAHSEDGRVLMELTPADYDHRIALLPGTLPSTASPLEVPALSVQTIMHRLNWDRIDLVKMDIEGHEKILLAQNCEWLNSVETLCLEYHHHHAEVDLACTARRFGFLRPQRLSGEIWFLTRRRLLH